MYLEGKPEGHYSDPFSVPLPKNGEQYDQVNPTTLDGKEGVHTTPSPQKSGYTKPEQNLSLSICAPQILLKLMDKMILFRRMEKRVLFNASVETLLGYDTPPSSAQKDS